MAKKTKKQFGRRNEETQEKLQQRREQQREEMGSSESENRIGISDGVNVHWVVPFIEPSVDYVEDMLIHYRPFHRCSRPDPVPNPKADGGYDLDKRFNKCPRDMTAWETWDGAGRPEGPAKRKFKSDMPSHQSVYQAFDFSPFFKLTSDGRRVEQNKKVIKDYLDDYLEVVAVTDAEEKKTLLKEKVEAGLPEDVAVAAEVSPGFVITNKENGAEIRKIISDVYYDEDEDATHMPERYLASIIRTNDGDTFTGADGKERKKKRYEIGWVSKKLMTDWAKALDTEKLMDIAIETCHSFENIPPKSDSLQDRAHALQKLTPEEITQLLEEAGHSFDFRAEGGGEEESSGDGETFSPDDFESDILSDDDHAAAAALKAELEEE